VNFTWISYSCHGMVTGARMKKEVSQILETISNKEAMHVSNKRQRVGSSYRLPTLISFSSEPDMDEGNSSVSGFLEGLNLNSYTRCWLHDSKLHLLT
jgi:hypothetical protein